MRDWTVYVVPYEGYILLVLAFGLLILFSSFLRMRQFRFQGLKSGKWYYCFFYGLGNRELICLTAGTSRLFLVIAIVLCGLELRLTHIVCLLLLTLAWQMDTREWKQILAALFSDIIQVAGTCAGLFVYQTLLRYMADIRSALDIRITSIMLGIFIIIYNAVLWLNRLPQLGERSLVQREHKEKRRSGKRLRGKRLAGKEKGYEEA
ncbi:MAG: hypothetical protein LIO67_05205 [Lachnospiraceae bacterium]|nr:hypothetical protein [Lachnospiraceae bacterium]